MRRLLCGVFVLAASIVSAPSAMADFGLQSFEMSATNQNGAPDLQAGSHPYQLTTKFILNPPKEVAAGKLVVDGDLKDARVELPPGFVGDPNAMPKCSYPEFIANAVETCPLDTVVGWETTYVLNRGGEFEPASNPVYNMEAPPGVAAEFGFRVKNQVPVLLDASVRTGGDYGVTVNVRNISAAAALLGSKVTLWGVPADPSHDPIRGQDGFGGCLLEVAGQSDGGSCHVTVPSVPLLTNPTSCGVPRTATLSVDDWETPGNFSTGENVVSKTATLPELLGCEKLDFRPTLEVTPDGTAGSTPTGLNVDVHVPQESTVNPGGLGEADMKNTTVALPAGVQISPSAADGLLACSPAQIGFTGVNPQSGIDEFTPGAPSCPDASKVATARIKTPLLEQELEGAVYLAAPQNFASPPNPLENPFGSLVAMYLVAEDSTAGVLVKLAGRITLNPETGQLTATVENIPQFPVSDVKFRFFGTSRAPLATPALCGTYKTETSFAPWSGTPAVSPSSSFPITSGPNGSPCADPLPFAPSLATGTTNINAGSFSSLTTTLSREDGQQNIQSVQLHYPPGLSGLLSGVKLCPEQQANEGTCGPESLIGETIVSVGLGNDPFSVTGGKVYITGPYAGAPFGLSIVNPAKAGPFVLREGQPVVVRAKIEVDPHTAALTITTDSTGEHKIPTIIDGIPLQIKHVNVNVNRPGFTFNPTNCNPVAITGTIQSAQGATSPVSVPFQATNCAALKFQPKFTVSTSSKTSKANGASLTAKITYPSVPQGTEANIAKVKVDLPKQLPSRLTTLQKACTAAQFNANPAGCPAASLVGHATVHTPLLPVPLTGPAYFVSNGGEAFPNLIMVLQGYGITVDLVGDTFISKAGITSSTFKTVPDQPFSSFELNLPEGRFSALTANGSLCTQKLVMPTKLVAQNGAVINQNTPIGVTGCGKPKVKVGKIKVRGNIVLVTVATTEQGAVTVSGGALKTTRKTFGAGTHQVKVALTKSGKAARKHHRKTSVRVAVRNNIGAARRTVTFKL
jgi:hypothetical protein